jgi:alcohol dehydrogenase, propanol-preferring
MPKMKGAAVKALGKPLAVESAPVPELGADAIQVKIDACVCQTDLHAAEGDWPVKPRPSFIPARDGVGLVSAVDRNVESEEEGNRGGVPWGEADSKQSRDRPVGFERTQPNVLLRSQLR